MAIQAQLYPENLGLPLMGGGGAGGVSQDWLLNQNNIINNTNNTGLYVNGCGFNDFTWSNLQQQKHQQQFQFQQQQQQQEVLLQLQQQQHLIQLQNLQQQQQQQQQRISCENNNNNNNDGFVFLSSSKDCTTTTTATTASTVTTGGDYQMPVSFSPSFADQYEKERQEMDRLVTLQYEKLKMALQEQRKQHLVTMMRRLEGKAMQILRQKDEEIARAGKRTMELEEIIRKLEIENQEWQRLASENEAMVLSLNNTIAQIKEQGCCIAPSSSSSNEVDDAESCCNVNTNDNFSSRKRGRQEITEDDGEETGENSKREKTGEVLCKVCNSGNSCVLLLPCRHLCCCKGCEGLINVCPVCKSAKMASIEALLS